MNLVEFIRQCEKENKIYRFYHLPEWISLRREVLFESHNECYDCKLKGILTVGTDEEPLEVHHVNFVKVRPELALSKFYVDKNGALKPNLVALCHNCHDKRHNRFNDKVKEKFKDDERW